MCSDSILWLQSQVLKDLEEELWAASVTLCHVQCCSTRPQAPIDLQCLVLPKSMPTIHHLPRTAPCSRSLPSPPPSSSFCTLCIPVSASLHTRSTLSSAFRGRAQLLAAPSRNLHQPLPGWYSHTCLLPCPCLTAPLPQNKGFTRTNDF